MQPGISADLAKYLADHAHSDPDTVVLAGRDIHGYQPAFVADQLRARQKHRRRLPSMCADSRIVFPPSLHLEQCSSEQTARLKSELICRWSDEKKRQTLLDLTSGFGVDALAFSRIFQQVICVEPDVRLMEISRHNNTVLGQSEAIFINRTAEEYLRDNPAPANWIFIDPSRRRDGRRIIKLADAEPSVPDLLGDMLNVSSDILIKTSPMLDIAEALRSLPAVTQVAVVSVSNECREVLYHIQRNSAFAEPLMLCFNLPQDGSIGDPFEFRMSEEKSAREEFSEPRQFLFEPHASVLKAGAFRLAAARFDLFRMESSTHLYTGNQTVQGFPGRTFEIIRPLTRNEHGLEADVMVRNHPLKPAEIVKRYNIREGGEDVVIAFSSRHSKHLVLTRRVDIKKQ